MLPVCKRASYSMCFQYRFHLEVPRQRGKLAIITAPTYAPTARSHKSEKKTCKPKRRKRSFMNENVRKFVLYVLNNCCLSSNDKTKNLCECVIHKGNHVSIERDS